MVVATQLELERYQMTQPSTPKKVAICLSGLVRTYRETYQNFIDNLITPNKEHQIDVFISTWPIELSNNSMERTRRLAWYGESTPPFPESPIDYNDLQTKYRPAVIQIERPAVFTTDWYHDTPGVNIQSLMSMTYKIYACDLLRRQHELAFGFTYDAVIRARFDCLMPFPIVVDSYDLSVITAPNMMQRQIYPDRDWLNDKFAIGNSHVVKTYSDWYLNFSNMVVSGVPVQPETLLAEHLIRAGVKYNRFNCEMDIVRPSGY